MWHALVGCIWSVLLKEFNFIIMNERNKPTCAFGAFESRIKKFGDARDGNFFVERMESENSIHCTIL